MAHTGRLLRARLRRVSTVSAHRFVGPVQLYRGGDPPDDALHAPPDDPRWDPVQLDRLAELADAELTLLSGRGNDEFIGQVLASRDALVAILRGRPRRAEHPVDGPVGGYLDSEQALLAGHPRHPTPKWRSGEPSQWRRYAPEARTAFPLRWLTAATEHIQEHVVDSAGGDFDAHAGTAALLGAQHNRIAEGHLALPVHPWQYRMLHEDPTLGPVLRAALSDGVLGDIGEVGEPCHPTASVRTLYAPTVDRFLKTSLNVRITNCLRKNADYELAGAVALTRLIAGPVAALAAAHPGFGVLTEPAARTVDLPSRFGDTSQRHALAEALGTIARCGLRDRVREGERVHLAGTLAAEHLDPAGTGTRIADLAELAGTTDATSWATRWWQRYVLLLVPPVLRLWAEHGVVLEPHAQNVLVVVGADAMPVRMFARDLEGTKLVADRHSRALADMPPAVAEAVGYDEVDSWNRTAYCLFVNHLVEIAGALADLALGAAAGTCRFENRLWDELTEVVAVTSADLGHPPRLRALLAGVPLPAKANLLVRWARSADRHARYVPFPSPLGRPLNGNTP